MGKRVRAQAALVVVFLLVGLILVVPAGLCLDGGTTTHPEPPQWRCGVPRIAHLGGVWPARVMTALMVITVGLAGLHLLVQMLRGRSRGHRGIRVGAAHAPATAPLPAVHNLPSWDIGRLSPALPRVAAGSMKQPAPRNQRAGRACPWTASAALKERPPNPSRADRRYGGPNRPVGRANARWPAE